MLNLLNVMMLCLWCGKYWWWLWWWLQWCEQWYF